MDDSAGQPNRIDVGKNAAREDLHFFERATNISLHHRSHFLFLSQSKIEPYMPHR